MSIQQDCRLQASSSQTPALVSLPLLCHFCDPFSTLKVQRLAWTADIVCGLMAVWLQGLEGELVNDAYETHARIAIERCACTCAHGRQRAAANGLRRSRCRCIVHRRTVPPSCAELPQRAAADLAGPGLSGDSVLPRGSTVMVLMALHSPDSKPHVRAC
jgi:hypothetical protein